MAGGIKGAFSRVVDTIVMLSKLTYVTVGVVLTPDNKDTAEKIIEFADTLGVSDIRVIPAAQDGKDLPKLTVKPELLDKYPILKYRIEGFNTGKAVRGLAGSTQTRCGLVLDDMAAMDDKHYPCIIYLRENGEPIGEVGPNMRAEREHWHKHHDVCSDPICYSNCLDVCRDYNLTHARHNWIE